MIRIYASKLSGEVVEQHEAAGCTLDAWLSANVSSYKRMDSPPISVHLNGGLLSVDDWSRVVIADGDTLDIYPEPKNDTFNLLFNPAFHSKIGIMQFFMPETPKQQDNNKKGAELDTVSARGNQVKTNSVIREIAGRRKVYPDYLLPLRRYFAGPTEQWAEMLLCIGKGKFDIPASRVLVGDTPMISLGSDAQFTIYQPGADLSAEPAAIWWHSAPEVGSSSTGTAGLELKATFGVSPIPTASAYIFSGDLITIPSGAGQFPTGWSAGMIVRIEAEEPYTVGSADGRDYLEGSLAWLAPFAGMVLEIAGDAIGTYVIDEFTPGVDGAPDRLTLNYLNGSPVAGLPLGPASLSIGYAGLRYRLTAASASAISVERITDTGGVDPSIWSGFNSFSSTSAQIALDGSTQEGNWCGPFACCPQGEKATQLEWDVMFSNGLFIMNKYGNAAAYSVGVELQYRDIDTAGAWTSIRKTYTAGTLDQIGYTDRITLPYPMRAEVRMRRIGAKSGDTNVSDDVEWYGLRANLPIKKAYEGVTVMAVRVRGGNRISSKSEQLISVEATRVLPVRSGNGTWDVESPTRDIVPFIAHVARSIGYTDDDLDMPELERLGAVWAARGDYFDFIADSSRTVKQVLSDAMAAGFADLTIDRGRIRPVRDEPRATFEQGYSPQNMTDELTRQFKARKPDDFDGVDVEYTDGITWQKETVKCRLPGDIGRRVEKVKVEGVTDRTRAWRIGMRQRMIQKYRRWGYRFSTELDALNSRYLSYVPLQDDVPGYGQSAIMLSYDSGIIESSEPLDWSAGGTHVVGIRRPDGTLSGPYAATRIDDYRLSITGLDFEPDTSWSIEPPHLLFGPVNRWSYPALITSISPSGDGASVEAVNYHPAVYAYDDAIPPADA
ncbi:host specificity factor TipJ family phage tail protein [Stutzerimonas nitrititolerans]|uniref:host specificity factor TipJ family phage tail protein n=1 Tax=Stutzerimonas nitrititolerans TaxID=2482751 RepID=UPI0028AE96FA|nr:host specificity factor TipJ family phage tail protein [Stutzerimonas nitrititolerans]